MSIYAYMTEAAERDIAKREREEIDELVEELKGKIRVERDDEGELRLYPAD